MILIKGENACIELQIIDISNNPVGFSVYDNSITCDFVYKNKEVIFPSKDIFIFDFELRNLCTNLKALIKHEIENYIFQPDREVASINFSRDPNSSDFILDLQFYLEWESDTVMLSKLRVSEEQLRDFVQEIHFIELCFAIEIN